MNNKIKKLQELISSKNLDAAVITSRPNNVYYSAFTGSTSIIIVTQDIAIFATDFRYFEHANALCGNDFNTEEASVGLKYMARKLEELKVQRIGFEDEDISYSTFMKWQERLPKMNFVGIQSEISLHRQFKDVIELQKIQSAVDIADNAFSHILKFIKVGVSELDIAAEIEYFMKRNGATGPSFDTISISGTNTSRPHGMPSDKLVEAGDPITMDFGALVNGYCSDMTRTVFAGTPSEQMRKIYNTVLQAQEESQNGAIAGKTGIEVDDISRKIIYGAGYEGCYGHGLGHSVGIEVHENPRFNTRDDTIMKNGMVMTVEPGIYVPGTGGVRIENMIVINDDKPINMTNSTKELIIL